MAVPNQQPPCLNTIVPFLPAEPVGYPDGLLDQAHVGEQNWWLLYTKSRQEKKLMRHLRTLQVPHYAPQVEHRQRSPSGRVRSSFQPLFHNYVFLCGDEESRYQAICTGCVQKHTPIENPHRLIMELRQIRDLIELDVPLSIEGRIEKGQHVRVKNGVFAGYEGWVLQRTHETHLLVSVQFMDQGISVKLDDCQLETI